MEDSQTTTIFTNMYSLLNPQDSTSPWPLVLELPNIFGGGDDALNIEKSLKPVSACPHTDRKHYAKNMCSRCYHKHGRDKLAWGCSHKDRPHYAKGRCQVCYLKMYYRRRRY